MVTADLVETNYSRFEEGVQEEIRQHAAERGGALCQRFAEKLACDGGSSRTLLDAR